MEHTQLSLYVRISQETLAIYRKTLLLWVSSKDQSVIIYGGRGLVCGLSLVIKRFVLVLKSQCTSRLSDLITDS